MPGEKGSSSLPQSSAAEPVVRVWQRVEQERMAEMIRLAREAAERNLNAKQATISSGAMSSGIEASSRESPGPGAADAASSNEAISNNTTISTAAPGPAMRIRGETARPAPLQSSEAIPKLSDEPRLTVRSPEPVPTPPGPIENTLTSNTSNPIDSSSGTSTALTAQAGEASALMQLERLAPEPVPRPPPKKIERRIAEWYLAARTALRRPWPEAIWDFYERVSDLHWWWRVVLKPALKFLSRCIPRGNNYDPVLVSKVIEEYLRDRRESAPPPPTERQPNKPNQLQPR